MPLFTGQRKKEASNRLSFFLALLFPLCPIAMPRLTHNTNTVNVLHFLKPLMAFVPEVAQPDPHKKVCFVFFCFFKENTTSKKHADNTSSSSQIAFKEKLMWTVVSLFIFLVCSQVPLYGILNSDQVPPAYCEYPSFQRFVFFSHLGRPLLLDACDSCLQPWHAHGARYHAHHHLGHDLPGASGRQPHRVRSQQQGGPRPLQRCAKAPGHALDCRSGAFLADVQTHSKILFAMYMQATISVVSGIYGSPSDLGAFTCVILVVQLFFAGLIVILVDEIMTKGYELFEKKTCLVSEK